MIKKIIIHFGPPKTGSSAIQNWLNQNSQHMLKCGILYPNHPVDSNHVSAGNVTSIFTYGKSGTLYFDNDKAKNLRKKFARSNAHTLLLSSEYFLFELETISKAFPNALFVGYIRNPLEYMESIYNQSVKRHGNANKFDLEASVNTGILQKISKHVEDIGIGKFHFRAYGKNIFPHGDVVPDFLTFLQVDKLYKYRHEMINESYSFEALEVKRWLNQFDLAFLSGEIDSVLQRFTSEIKNFSLIPPQNYDVYKMQNAKCKMQNAKCKMQSADAVIDFCRAYDVLNSTELAQNIRSVRQYNNLEQSLDIEQVRAVVAHILASSGPLFFSELCYVLKSQLTEHTDNKEFIKVFTEQISTSKLKFRSPTLLKGSLWLNKLHHFIKYKLKSAIK